jgi:hypothetical protein
MILAAGRRAKMLFASEHNWFMTGKKCAMTGRGHAENVSRYFIPAEAQQADQSATRGAQANSTL